MDLAESAASQIVARVIGAIPPMQVECLRHDVIAAIHAEREACAKIADGFTLSTTDVGRLDGQGDDAETIAASIRARGELY